MKYSRSSLTTRPFLFLFSLLLACLVIGAAAARSFRAQANWHAPVSALASTAAARTIASLAATPMTAAPMTTAMLQAATCSPFGFSYGTGFAPEPNTEGNPISVVSGDFNKDGKLDLIAANLFGSSISVLIGDGAGGFSMPNNILVVSDGRGVPSSLAVGDFNSDGNLDLAISILYNPGRLFVMNGDSVGNFTFANAYDAGVNSNGVAVGDFNSDGKVDIAVTNKGEGASLGNISVFLNDGSGGFGTATNFTAGTYPTALVIGDFTSDSKNDIAVANSGTNNVSILAGNGAGSFAAAINFAVGANPAGITAGYFNGDTRLDLAVTNSTDNNVSILMANGSGSFNSAMNYAAGIAPYGIIVSDFDSNGKPDLAVTNSSSNQTSVLLNDGTGAFGTPTPLTVGVQPLSLAAGDFNGDTKADLAVANNTSNNISILLSNGNGTFRRSTFLLSNPQSVALADFNADTKPDIAVVNFGADKVTLFLAGNSGSYSIPQEFAAGIKPIALDVDDFNLDGKADLAVANNGSATISLFRGDGLGGFSTPTEFAAGTQPRAIVADDFNKDGYPDVATANEGANNVTVLLNNGVGGFSAPTAFTAGAQPVDITSADISNDGKLDLIVANLNSTFVSVLLGNGTGGFTAGTNANLGGTNKARTVEIGDLNNDNKPDLIVGLDGQAKIAVLLGTTPGNFGAATILDTGANPTAVGIGDFDGDGKADIVVTNNGNRNLSILRGNGDGTFAAQKVFDTGFGPISLALGDLNNDRRLDIAVANAGSNSLSLLLNSCANTPPAITPGAALTRAQGSAPSVATLATISDIETAAGSLTFSFVAPAGVQVTNVTNTAGTITAQVTADCAATIGNKIVALTVSDGSLSTTTNFTVNVAVNEAPVLGNYPNAEVLVNNIRAVTPAAPLSDNGTIATLTATASAGFTGTLNVTPTTGVVTATNAAPTGTYTITVTATDNCGTTSTKTFQLNVVPPVAITSLDPSTKQAQSGAFTLMVNGSGFTANSKVNWNGTERATTFVSATKLSAAILASDINLMTAGSANITVFDPGAGGITSNTSAFTISAPNPVPTIASLNPATVIAGDAGFTLTLNGTNFLNGSVVKFNGTDRTTTYISETQLSIAVTATDIATAGTAALTVVNPAPGGGTSNTLNLAINNPTPGAITLSPNAALLGSGATLLTVNGSAFRANSVIRVNGVDRATTFVSTSQLTTTLAIADLATAGTLSITVNTPAPGGGVSPPAPFTVNNPTPTIVSLAPATVIAGDAGFTLTINGTNFLNSSGVKFNGADRSTTFVSPTQLSIAVTATDIANAGTAALTVVNPAPGGGTSNTLNLAINNPTPGAITLSPNAALLGSGATLLTVNGSAFRTNSVIRVNGVDRATTFVSTSQLTTTLAIADLATAGTLSITVNTPAPGGGVSPPALFTVNNPTPTIASLNPATVIAGDAGFTLTLNGTNFLNSSVVKFNGADRPTTFVSPTQLSIAVTATDIANAGTVTLMVTNPTPGGGTSNTQNLAINNPAPGAITLSPNAAVLGSGATLLTVNGSSFRPNSVIRVNGVDRATTVVSTSQLTTTLAIADLATAGTLSITVFTPAPGGGTSAPVLFSVNNPTPTITSLTPSTVLAGDLDFTLTINGTGFLSSSVVKFNGADRAKTFVSSTLLTIAVTAADIANTGTINIAVVNPEPGGGTSNTQSVAINNPLPVLTSLSQASAQLGSAATPITLTGSKFRSNSIVRVNGADRPTTFTSATTLGVTLTTTDLAASGTLKISVFTPAPGGGTSAEINFTVGNPVPALTTLNPTTVLAGGAAFTLTVNGSGFVNTSVVKFNGADRTTTFVNGGQLTVAVTAADIANAGTAKIIVFNPAPFGGTSSELSLAINNPAPVSTTLSQVAITSGAGATNLTINGTNFRPNSVVRVNGLDRVTTYVSATQLTVALLASDLINAGILNITVFTPAPGGGTSTALQLTVNNPAPTLVSISPNSAFKGDPAFMLTVTGTNFVNGSIVRWNGTDRVTTFVSSTQLKAAILESDLAIDGMANVTVSNPSPGGGLSSAVKFTINALTGYEGDLSPRPNGNNDGKVTLVDFVQAGRFAAGADTVQNSSEFQRADCAPLNTNGDGRISISDWVQAGRFAAGLDPVIPAAGPSRPASLLGLDDTTVASKEFSQSEATRIIRARNTEFKRGEINALPIELEAQGNESGFSFSLNYDPKLLSFAHAQAPEGWSVNINSAAANQGRIGLMLTSTPGRVVAFGKQNLLTVYFAPMGGSDVATTKISFDDQIFDREIADVAANILPQAVYEAATINITGRAIANVRAASYVGPDLAGDSIASAFGVDLATSTVAAATVPLPTNLAGTSVEITDSKGVKKAAQLFFVSATQVNYLLPAEIADGVATVTITNSNGVISRGLLTIKATAPSLFSADSSGTGVAAAQAVRVAADNSQVWENVARFDQATSKMVAVPIDLGEKTDRVYLVLYGTGLKRRSDLSNVQLRVGSVVVPVEYAAAHGFFAGVDQINARLPRTLLGRGEVNVELLVDGQTANVVRVAIK